jgi:hypothetical protein
VSKRFKGEAKEGWKKQEEKYSFGTASFDSTNNSQILLLQ